MVKNLNPPYKLIDISAYLHQLLIPSPIIIEHIHLLSPIYIIYRNASEFHHLLNVSTTAKNTSIAISKPTTIYSKTVA